MALRRVGIYSIGFAITFTLLGVGVMGISRFFIVNRELFAALSGLVLVVMALFILFGHKIKKLSFMYAQKKFTVDINKVGYGEVTPFVLGAANAFPGRRVLAQYLELF